MSVAIYSAIQISAPALSLPHGVVRLVVVVSMGPLARSGRWPMWGCFWFGAETGRGTLPTSHHIGDMGGDP